MEVQERISKKKGNQSRDSFGVGDKVRIRSNHDGRWSVRGVITEARSSGTSSPPASFMVLSESGAELLRHKSYLKHDASAEDLDNDPPTIETPTAELGSSEPVPVDPAETQAMPWEGRLRTRREQ